MPYVYTGIVFVVNISAVIVSRNININPEEVCVISGILDNGAHVNNSDIDFAMYIALKVVDGFVGKVTSGVVYMYAVCRSRLFCGLPDEHGTASPLLCASQNLSMPSLNPPVVLVTLLF